MRAQMALVLVPWCPLLATRQMSPCRTLEGLNGKMCELLHTSLVVQKMHHRRRAGRAADAKRRGARRLTIPSDRRDGKRAAVGEHHDRASLRPLVCAKRLTHGTDHRVGG